MCYHRSCIVTKDERILFHPQSDHHTDIRREYGIRELKNQEERDDHVALECIPVHSLFDLGGWKVKLDQHFKPSWYDKSIEKAVLEKMVSEFKRRACPEVRVYRSETELAFGYLETFDDETTLISGGRVLLTGYRRPIRGMIIKAKEVIIPRNNYRFMQPDFEGCIIACQRLSCEDYQLQEFLEKSGQIVNPRYRHREMDMTYRYDQVVPLHMMSTSKNPFL